MTRIPDIERDLRRKEAREIVAIVSPLIEQMLVKQMTAILGEIHSRVAGLQATSRQHSAKLQILRSIISEENWELACQQRPQMRGWFDGDGVPV